MTITFLYGKMGEDYPYHMAKTFNEGLTPKNGWNEEQLEYFKSLKDVSQLQTLLKQMEMDGLLVSRHDGGHHYFMLNPRIVFFPMDLSELCHFHRRGVESDWITNEVYIIKFFIELEKEERMTWFKRWSSAELFDFITFLQFLSEEADKLKMERVMDIIDKNIKKIKSFETLKKTGVDMEIWADSHIRLAWRIGGLGSRRVGTVAFVN